MATDRRRTTLGVLSPSQLNSKNSVPLLRQSKEGSGSRKQSTFGGRPSLLGNKAHVNNAPSRLAQVGGPRRSSSYGKVNSGPKPDPRPVNDKVFQASCSRCLIGYLSTHGYEYPISPKMLASPMSKDFTNIVHFLMRQVDPNMNQKTLGKIEDDVPAFFKRLRYPFQISKSSLFAVGSPHTWPSLLASLVWLVELLFYNEKAARTKASLEDERQRAESEFFEFVAGSYRSFLAGDDEKCEEVDRAKAAEFEEKAAEVEAQNSQIAKENADIQSKLRELQDTPSPLTAATAELAEKTADREKFKKLIENVQAHTQSLRMKVQERQSDVVSKTEQLAQIEQECKELEVKIAAQTFNRDDVNRMSEERVKKESILQSAEIAREGLQKKVCEQEVLMELRLDELEVTLQEYNTAADRLQLIPTTAKRAGGIQYEVKMNRAGASAAELVNLDFKGPVKTGLGRIREAAVGRGRQLNEERLALQERKDSLCHSLTERTEENATRKVQVNRMEKQLTMMKEEREAEIRNILAEADRIKEDITSLKDTTSQSTAQSSGRVRALQKHHEDLLKRCEMDRNLLYQEYADGLHLLTDHKQQISSTLQKTQAQIEKIVSEIRDIKV